MPETMRALVLDGAGFEHLSVREVPVPQPGPDQLLARVDAAGICTSLIKLVEQGPAHKQVYGWDLARHPLILGDEGAVTIVEAGADLRERYRPGSRFVIQPAVDHAPIIHRERYRDQGRGVEKVAVGYTLPGHLAEYVLVTEEVLAAGCILPCPDLPYAHAAIAEPISCVISAQDHHVHLVQNDVLRPRRSITGLKPGGVAVVLGAGAMGRMHVELAISYRPRAIVAADPIGARLAIVRSLFAERAAAAGVELHTINPQESNLAGLVDRLTSARGADDVIVAVGSARAIEESQQLTGRGAVLNLFGGLKKGEDVVGFDTGVIHYKEINVTGSSGGSPFDVARTLELMASGAIDPSIHITRIGDLEHAIDFLRMIRGHELDGKAVVYPHKRIREILAVRSWSAGDEREFLVDG